MDMKGWSHTVYGWVPIKPVIQSSSLPALHLQLFRQLQGATAHDLVIAINWSCLNITWGVPSMGDLPNGLFIMENTIKMDDLGYPISGNLHINWNCHPAKATCRTPRSFNKSINKSSSSSYCGHSSHNQNTHKKMAEPKLSASSKTLHLTDL